MPPGLQPFLDLDFAEGLVAILKHHQGLRVCFPDLILYRKEAASGELADESLHEYFDKILDLIANNTPQVFSKNITEKLARTEPTGDSMDAVVSPEEITEAAKEGIVPPELLNDIDPHKAEDVAKAGLLHRIYEVLLTFDAGGKNADRIEKTISSYGKLIKHVLDWLE